MIYLFYVGEQFTRQIKNMSMVVQISRQDLILIVLDLYQEVESLDHMVALFLKTF